MYGFDGHHSDGSSFVYVSVITKKKKKQVKSPNIWSRTRTRFGSANRVGPGIEALQNLLFFIFGEIPPFWFLRVTPIE